MSFQFAYSFWFLVLKIFLSTLYHSSSEKPPNEKEEHTLHLLIHINLQLLYKNAINIFIY